MTAGDHVKVLKVWAHGHQPEWFGGYVFVRERDATTCELRDVARDHVVLYPKTHIRFT